MRPFTIKQLELLTEISQNANSFHLGGLENKRDIHKLKNWKRFNPSVIEEIEQKFFDIATIGEEISGLTCKLKNSRKRR